MIIARQIIAGFLLLLLLFADVLSKTFLNTMGPVLQTITEICRDPQTQWLVFMCLATYGLFFLLVPARTTPEFWRNGNPRIWLVGLLSINAIIYTFKDTPAVEVLTLSGGAAIGIGFAWFAGFLSRQLKPESSFITGTLSVLLLLLALSSLWHGVQNKPFTYHGQIRWSGPWDNPNIAGLLMGVGVLLAAGLAWRFWELNTGIARLRPLFLCLGAAGLTGFALLNTHSRGAWLGTGCGLVYLIFSGSRQFDAWLARETTSEISGHHLCPWHQRHFDE